MGILRKLWRRSAATAQDEPPATALTVLEELHRGQHRDYCLYLRPDVPVSHQPDALAPDLESLIIAAFTPLLVLPIERATPPLPDEAFVTLAESARVLWLTPTDGADFLHRLALLKATDAFSRCIFLMPENGTFGQADWSSTWATSRAKAAGLGIELSAYTAGGWLFRLDQSGKACTFRPITNPNEEKIAKALEAICEQMG
jgi:hypothetical protein